MKLIQKYLRQHQSKSIPLANKLPTGVELSKLDGAINQIMAAIEMLLRGRYECALTLAGAAEGILPSTPDSVFEGYLRHTTPDELKDHEFADFTRTQRIAFFNRQRDWLKHPTQSDAGPLIIDRRDAEDMIVRALSKLPEVDFAPEQKALLDTFFPLWIHDLDWEPPSK